MSMLKNVLNSLKRNVWIGIMAVVVAAIAYISLSIIDFTNATIDKSANLSDITGQLRIDKEFAMREAKTMLEGENLKSDSQEYHEKLMDKIAEFVSPTLDEFLKYSESDTVKNFFYAMSTGLNGTTIRPVNIDPGYFDSENATEMPGDPGMFGDSQSEMPGGPGMSGDSQSEMPGGPGMPGGPQSGMPGGPGMPGGSQNGMPGGPGMPGGSQSGMPGGPGMPGGSQSGMPSSPGMPGDLNNDILETTSMTGDSQSGMPVRPGMSGGSQNGIPAGPEMPGGSQNGIPAGPEMPGGPGNPYSAMSEFTVIGYSDKDAIEVFKNGNGKILEGDLFDFDSAEFNCMITKELAYYNYIRVGDVITLENPDNEEELFDLTVCGIYEIPFESSSTGTQFVSHIIMSYAAVERMVEASKEASGENALSGMFFGSFVFADMSEYNAFKGELKEKGMEDKYILTSEDVNAYNASLIPLENLSDYATIFLWVILVVGAVGMAAINLIKVYKKKNEINKMTDGGMKKSAIALKFILEVLAVTVIAIIIGTVIGAVISAPVSNSLLHSLVEKERAADMMAVQAPIHMVDIDYVDSISTSLSVTLIVQMIIIAIVLTVVSSFFSILFIMRYKGLNLLVVETLPAAEEVPAVEAASVDVQASAYKQNSVNEETSADEQDSVDEDASEEKND